MTAALDLDPYLLPLPAPDSPVVIPHRATSLHAHLNGRYADPAWPLAPLTGNPSVTKVVIGWDRWPAVFRDEMRLAAWNLINGQLRPAFLHARGTTMRSRLSLSGVHYTIEHWKALAAWLADRGIGRLADCGPDILHEYGLHVRDSGRSRSVVAKILVSLTRLWALDRVSARPNGIGRPPWEDRGVDDYLPTATGAGGGENSTEPIAEQTMSPLLIWAMRMVDDLSGDIIAGWAERQRLAEAARATTATPAGTAALEAYLRSLVASGTALPATVNQGKAVLAKYYIGGITGASVGQVELIRRREGLTAIAAERPGPCPLDVPVTGKIEGKPWREALDYNEAPELMRHLGTASFIACAFLTGMRPGEILGLRTGCCPDPAPGPDGQARRHLIRGYEFKTATDEDGNHAPAGVEREVPRVAITPVVNAIRVLERMVPDGHLLSPTTRTGRSAWAGSAGAWPGISRAGRTGWSPWPSSTGTCGPPSPSTGRPRATAPAAATASTTSSTWRPPARPPTPSWTSTRALQAAAAYPVPLPAARSGPRPRHPASPAPPSPSPAPASC